MGLYKKLPNSRLERIYIDRLCKDVRTTGLLQWMTNFFNIDWDLTKAKGLAGQNVLGISKVVSLESSSQLTKGGNTNREDSKESLW